MDVFLLDVEVKGHSILFEDMKRRVTNQQIHFIGASFIIMGMKLRPCAWSGSLYFFKEKKNGKQDQICSHICSFVIIKKIQNY